MRFTRRLAVGMAVVMLTLLTGCDNDTTHHHVVHHTHVVHHKTVVHHVYKTKRK